MGIPEEIKGYIEGQIDYYISEAGSYRQIAEEYTPEVGSVPDAAFGIIAGCVYSAFLQAYQGRGMSPSLVDMREFNVLLKGRAPLIKGAILGSLPGHQKDHKPTART
ncbi:conserved hypothetical protein [Cenarchaeum symbiosum A]|uniref:Uncharacterized protein n=1 Tax=Cenarchaeum symbiosum (strain A) TaxID=414004 RepID=A0RUW7_CENSY|nr:conserved hypothetical protein [Cenarchaeum symbiosum A]